MLLYGVADTVTGWIDNWSTTPDDAEALVATVEADSPELTGTLAVARVDLSTRPWQVEWLVELKP